MNATQKTTRKAGPMKITMQTVLAGPHGVAKPGTVLELPEDQAKILLDCKCARPFDSRRDAKAKVGLTVAGADK